MSRLGQRERESIGKEIDALADEIHAVGLIGSPNVDRNEKLRALQNKLDVLRDQLCYVRGRT